MSEQKTRFEVLFKEVENKKILSIKRYSKCECCNAEKPDIAVWAEFPMGLHEDELTGEYIIANLRGLADILEKKMKGKA